MLNNLLEQDLISTTVLQKNLFSCFRSLQQNDQDKLIGVLNNNKIVGFLANKKMIDGYFDLQRKKEEMEEMIADLEDALVLKESKKQLKKSDLVLAEKVYKKLGL